MVLMTASILSDLTSTLVFVLMLMLAPPSLNNNSITQPVNRLGNNIINARNEGYSF